MEMKRREVRRERPSNDSGEMEEMELLSNDVKRSDDNGKEKGKSEEEDEQDRQTGERGETTRRNQTQVFLFYDIKSKHKGQIFYIINF